MPRLPFLLIVALLAMAGGRSLLAQHARPLILDFRPTAIEFSRKLDRMVILAGNELLLFDPQRAQVETALSLRLPGLQLALSRDGGTAAVYHAGWIAIFDLELRAETHLIPVEHNPFAYPILGPRPWLYLVGNGLRQLNYERPSQTAILSGTSGNAARGAFTGDGKRLYLMGQPIQGLLVGDDGRLEPFSTSSRDVPYGRDIPWQFWFNREENRLITSSGAMFRVGAAAREEDLQPVEERFGPLEPPNPSGVVPAFAHLVDLPPTPHALAVIDGLVSPTGPFPAAFLLAARGELQIVDRVTGAIARGFSYPRFRGPGGIQDVSTRYLFLSANAKRYYAFVHAPNRVCCLLEDWAFVSGSVDLQSIHPAFGAPDRLAPGQLVQLAMRDPAQPLAGAAVRFIGSDGGIFPARVISTVPGGLGAIVPEGMPLGDARLEVSLPDSTGGDFADLVTVVPISPGIPTVNNLGIGRPVGQAIYLSASGAETRRHTLESAAIQFEFGTVFLELRVVGAPGRAPSDIKAVINGVDVPVASYAPDPDQAGMEKIRLGPVPPVFRGRVEAKLVLTIEGVPANPIDLSFFSFL